MSLRNAPMTILPTEDITRSRTFYEETLNLRPADVPVPGDALMFECGDSTMLYIYAKEGGTKAEHTVGGWVVEDVEATVEALTDRGVVFETYDRPGLKTDERGVGEIGEAKVAWFKDPDGNILSITEMPV